MAGVCTHGVLFEVRWLAWCIHPSTLEGLVRCCA